MFAGSGDKGDAVLGAEVFEAIFAFWTLQCFPIGFVKPICGEEGLLH